MNSTVRRPAIFLGPLLVVAVSFAIIVARRPDILFYAQPWAEDGTVWMAQIYNDGFWHSLIQPQNGYFQSISRLAFGAGLSFGLEWAPLVANIISILVRCMIVLFILSGRFSFADVRFRWILAAYILLMPGVSEAYVNITNAHWYLSIYLLAVILADEPRTRAWRFHDYAVLLLSALSGPFVVFMAVALFVKRWAQRGGLVNAVVGINTFDVLAALCFAIQLVSILVTGSSARSPAPLGFEVGLMVNILSYRLVIDSLLPINAMNADAIPYWVNVSLCTLTVAACIYAGLKGGWRIWVGTIFVVLFMCFAFARPMLDLVKPQLPFLLDPGMGGRYFIIPKVGLVCIFLFCLYKIGQRKLWAAGLCAAVALPFMLRDFSIAPLPRSTYYEDVETFLAQPSGTPMKINISPGGWTASLVRK